MLEHEILVLFQLILLMICFQQFENSTFIKQNWDQNILDKPVYGISNRTPSLNSTSDVFGIKFRRNVYDRRKRDALVFWDEFMILRRARKERYEKFSKISINKTKTGEMNVNCTYNNDEIRKEDFEAAFFEVKRHQDTEYQILLGLDSKYKILWSKNITWPHSVNIGDSVQQSAKVFLRNHSKVLSLYVSPENCHTQGKYRCVVFVHKNRGSQRYKYTRSESREWTTTECNRKMLEELKKNDPVNLYWKRITTEHSGGRVYNGPKFAHIQLKTTREGPIKITCTWDNREHRRERFFAAFIDIKTSENGGYKNIVLMKRNQSIIWSNQLKWPRTFTSGGTSHRSAVGKIIQKTGTYLSLYASRKECDVDEGWYQCTIFVRRPGNKLIYKSTVKRWMTLDCMTKNGRFKSKAAWGAGASDANNADQFLFEMNSISGKVLSKSSTLQLVNITRGIYRYIYREKKINMAAHECKPTLAIIQKATHTLGIVFEIKKFGENHYQPVAGINDRNRIIWSDTVYWDHKYKCGSKGEKCSMAIGSVLDDPYLVLYTKNCKDNRGYYRCNVFVQLAGSPGSEAIVSEVPFNYSDCGKPSQGTDLYRPRPGSSNASYVTQLETEGNATDIAIGTSVGVLFILILIYLIWSTKKKIKENREKEEKIILMHQQKFRSNNQDQSKGADNLKLNENQFSRKMPKKSISKAPKKTDFLVSKKSLPKDIQKTDSLFKKKSSSSSLSSSK